MTLKELSQLYYLRKEIESDNERLLRLQSEVLSYGTPDLSGMPRGGTGENRLERLIAEIVDLERIITDKLVDCVAERVKLERYIASVDDSLTRQILTLRFVENEPWYKVALDVGGGNTAEGVKKRAYRSIKGKVVPQCPTNVE